MKATQSLNGAGIGLRSQHYQTILKNKPDVPWFEVLTDNYMGAGGLPLYHLEQVRNNYPISFHGVGLSLGSADPINMKYLSKLKQLIKRYQPVHVSDHLAWVSIHNHYTHELLPFPYNHEALEIVSDKINHVQDFLGQALIVENPSTYLGFNNSEMAEWNFIQEVVNRTGCELLIDINNIYVSASNHGFNPVEYISSIPKQRVKEIHLAGYEDRQTYLYDTHGYSIHDVVWDLYEVALSYFDATPTLIEWDNDIPGFDILLNEANKAQNYLNQSKIQQKIA